MSTHTPSNDSREQILYLLKTRGPQTAQFLAGELGISAVGARQHLKLLADEGLLERFSRAEKVGRPSDYWRLSEKAQSRFPDRHGDLTLALIDNVRELFGNEGLDALIARREEQTLADYRRALEGCKSLAGRVKKLATLRSREGYMSEAIKEGKNRWLLAENHCPICAAARKCRGFCRSELEIFRLCLPGARVERCEYLLDGARRCTYRIQASGD